MISLPGLTFYKVLGFLYGVLFSQLSGLFKVHNLRRIVRQCAEVGKNVSIIIDL